MPDLSHPAMPAGFAAHVPAPLPYGDDDVALGCECADPALQIERWGMDAAGDAARPDSH